MKSLRGEQLSLASLTPDGVAGDRLVHVAGSRGVLSGRTRNGLLSLQAGSGPDGEPVVEGHPWASPEAAELVRARAGADARLVASTSPARFDITNLLVITAAEVAAIPGPAIDLRRLRPNLVLADDGDDDDGHDAAWPWPWDGAALAVGDAVIGVHSQRPRCVVTSIDPVTGEQDLDVFRRIRRHADNLVGLNCWVIRPGTVTVGDTVTLVPTSDVPDNVGGWIVGADYPSAG